MVLAPRLRRAIVRPAPPGFEGAPEAATGRRAPYSLRAPSNDTRNGTLSSVDPQRGASPTQRRARGEAAATERARGGRGGGSRLDERPTRCAAGIDWAKEEHALCIVEEEGRGPSGAASPTRSEA